MHTFARTITVAALSTFVVILVSAQGGEIVEGFDISSTAGEKFIDRGYRVPSSLAEGPYSVFAAKAELPVFASGIGSLEKRAACNCDADAGYGCCSNGQCCRSNQLCTPTGTSCCELDQPYTCGGSNCCPFKFCAPNGQCGCESASKTRCGKACCDYGCTGPDNSQCACPTTYPVVCPAEICCPAGSTCVKVNGNERYQCHKGNTIPSGTNNSIPQPTSGSSGNGATDATGIPAVVPTAAGNNLEGSSGSVALLIAVVAIVLA